MSRRPKSQYSACTGSSSPKRSQSAIGEESRAPFAKRASGSQSALSAIHDRCFCDDRGGLDDVESALSFGKARPTASSRIFSGTNGARAMRAADAGIVLIVQFVVRHVVIVDVTPYLLRRPVGNRIDLDQIEFRIPFDSSCA